MPEDAANAQTIQRLTNGINVSNTLLTGEEARLLMRHARTTIRGVATAKGLTMKRVREVRERGVVGYFQVCEWIEILTGINVFSRVAYDLVYGGSHSNPSLSLIHRNYRSEAVRALRLRDAARR